MMATKSTITKQLSNNEQFWIGMIFGIFCTVLIGLSLDKIFSQPITLPSSLDIPKDIITAYNTGVKDALAVNPPSADLEYACAALWSNKQ
jgi:hypothetical protein